MLRIFRLRQKPGNPREIAGSCCVVEQVVQADNELAARCIASEHHGLEGAGIWKSAQLVECELIGLVHKDSPTRRHGPSQITQVNLPLIG